MLDVARPQDHGVQQQGDEHVHGRQRSAALKQTHLSAARDVREDLLGVTAMPG